MVLGKSDVHIINDVTFVVEDTALAGTRIQEMKLNYIIPTLEHFNGGSASDMDWAAVNCNNTYTLILFRASDSLPGLSVSVRGPFTTIKRFMNAFEKIEFVGGMCQNYSSGVEGVARAIQFFDDLDSVRKRNFVDLISKKFIVYIANTVDYGMPVRDTAGFLNITMDDLTKQICLRGINLSVMAPRRLPFFYSLFEKSGGDIKTWKSKNYAKDPYHLIMLSGFQLQEQPFISIIPTSTQTLNVNALSQNINNSSTVPHIEANFDRNLNNVSSSSSATPLELASLSVQSPAPAQNVMINTQTGNMGVATLQHQGANNIRMTVQQTRMVGSGVHQQQPQGGGGGAGMMQQQQQQPSMAIVRPMWTTQQPMSDMSGGQNTSSAASTLAAAAKSNLLRERLSHKVQQQQQQQQTAVMVGSQQPVGDVNCPENSTLKNLLNHSNMSHGQAHVGNMSPLQQQLSRPVAVVTANKCNTIGQGAPQQQQMSMSSATGHLQSMNTGMSTQQVATRPREIIWEGELQWLESSKVDINQEKIMHSVKCKVTSSVGDNGLAEVKSDNWPKKLITQLIPNVLVQSIGTHFFRNSRSVVFHPTPSETLNGLTRLLSTGFAGCVHFTGVSNCEIKVVILFYSNDKKAYHGYIPNDQIQFVDRIRQIIQQQKSEQQMRQSGVGVGAGINQVGATGVANSQPQFQMLNPMGGNVQMSVPVSSMQERQQQIGQMQLRQQSIEQQQQQFQRDGSNNVFHHVINPNMEQMHQIQGGVGSGAQMSQMHPQMHQSGQYSGLQHMTHDSGHQMMQSSAVRPMMQMDMMQQQTHANAPADPMLRELLN